MWDKESIYGLFKELIREHFIRREKLLSDLKLFRGQAPVLLILSEKEGLTQKEIAESLKIKPSTVTLIIRRMKKRGLIWTAKDNQDKRFTKIYLSEEGKKIICRLKKVFKQLETEMFRDFTKEDLERLEDYFKKIISNLREVNKG